MFDKDNLYKSLQDGASGCACGDFEHVLSINPQNMIKLYWVDDDLKCVMNSRNMEDQNQVQKS